MQATVALRTKVEGVLGAVYGIDAIFGVVHSTSNTALQTTSPRPERRRRGDAL
jgi:hypothetical protein